MKTQINFKSCLTRLRGLMSTLGYHSVVTLPSRCRLHRTLTIILLLLCIGAGSAWGEHTVVKAGDMVSGEKYIITAEYNSTRYYLTPGSFDVGKSTAGTYTTSLTDAAAWTFTKSSTSWTISTKVGNNTVYLANTNTNNGVKTQASSQTWTITATTSGANTVTITGASSRKLALYQGSNWRSYSSASGIQTITLYRYSAASTPTLTCATTSLSFEAAVDGTDTKNFTFSGSNLTANAGLAITGTNEAMFSVTPTSVDKGSGTITDQSVTVTYSPTVAGSHSATLTISSTGATSKTISLSGTATLSHNVYYYNNGTLVHTGTVADGGDTDDLWDGLDDDDACDDVTYKYFAGWSKTNFGSTPISDPTLNEAYTSVSSDVSYYAVWSDTEPSAGGWTKVTSISVGDVVVFAYDDDYKEMTSVTTTGTTYGSTTAVDPYPDDLSGVYALTVEAGNGGTGYSFKHGSVYLSWSSGNSLTTSGTKNNASSWTISESSSGNFKFANVGTTSRILQYNSGSPRWACYGNSGQSAFQIYKQSGGGDAEYITTCCTPLGTINGPIIFINVLWV